MIFLLPQARVPKFSSINMDQTMVHGQGYMRVSAPSAQLKPLTEALLRRACIPGLDEAGYPTVPWIFFLAAWSISRNPFGVTAVLLIYNRLIGCSYSHDVVVHFKEEEGVRIQKRMGLSP